MGAELLCTVLGKLLGLAIAYAVSKWIQSD